MRKIIHIDMDAFYASVEQRDNPELRGKPLAVGGGSKRGVISAASYEARKFGVKSAMPGRTAERLCPQLIFVKPRFDAYKEVSNQIRSIFFEYTNLVEPLSLDEAYLDVTENKVNNPIATEIAQEIRKKIFETTQLTASAGVSYNKFLAKIASDINKPNGIFVIKPKDAEAFIEKLPIEKFFGIGRVTADKLRKLGVFKGSDLKQLPKQELIRRFGKTGSYFYEIVRGTDNRPVVSHRVQKSIGAERTFAEDLYSYDEIADALENLLHRVFATAEKRQTFGKTIVLKIKFKDFRQITRSRSFPMPMSDFFELKASIFELLQAVDISPGVRLAGSTITNFETNGLEPVQLTINFE